MISSFPKIWYITQSKKNQRFSTLNFHWILLSSNCSKLVNFWARNMFFYSYRSEFRHKLTEFVIRELGRRNGYSAVKIKRLLRGCYLWKLIGAMRWLQVPFPFRESLQLSNASPSFYWAITNFLSNNFCFVSRNMLKIYVIYVRERTSIK